MNHIIEVPSLTIKPNTRAEFYRLHIQEILPLSQHWNFDVATDS